MPLPRRKLVANWLTVCSAAAVSLTASPTAIRQPVPLCRRSNVGPFLGHRPRRARPLQSRPLQSTAPVSGAAGSLLSLLLLLLPGRLHESWM